MAKLKILKDPVTGESFYPYTHEKAITDDNGNEVITAIKGDIDAEANERKEADNAINASLESHGTRLNNLENYTIKLDSEGYIAVEYKG